MDVALSHSHNYHPVASRALSLLLLVLDEAQQKQKRKQQKEAFEIVLSFCVDATRFEVYPAEGRDVDDDDDDDDEAYNDKLDLDGFVDDDDDNDSSRSRCDGLQINRVLLITSNGDQSTLRDEFLYSFDRAQHVVFTPSMVSYRTIGDVCLCYSNILSVDLSGLANVTYIGDEFLTDCCHLLSVNLTPFRSNLRRVGAGFLSLNNNLTHIDVSGLASLNHIGDLFLANCVNLAEVENMSVLTKVSSVGTRFLSGSGLSTPVVDVSGLLTNIVLIGSCFMNACDELTNVVL
eukprot:PhM_4_TR18833/c1_g1_i1/m.39786